MGMGTRIVAQSFRLVVFGVATTVDRAPQRRWGCWRDLTRQLGPQGIGVGGEARVDDVPTTGARTADDTLQLDWETVDEPELSGLTDIRPLSHSSRPKFDLNSEATQRRLVERHAPAVRLGEIVSDGQS